MPSSRSIVGSRVAVWFGAGIAFATACVAAAERLPEPPIYTAPHVDAALAHGAANAGRHDAAGASASLRPFGERASNVTLMELPREGPPGAGYQRPHHALGFRSSAAESWLHERGIDASNCYLPLIRLHTKLSRASGASGSFWVYARCALR
ncbi:MAG: hypothetical protein OHK0044_10400 [Burkholderiaceae bacterium]